MSRWLQNLNPEQRAAVQHVEGPLLVLAGAGSGKTRVITHRIAHLLERGIGPEHVLGVTFTNKAAEEMRHRLAAMVGPSAAAAVTLSTFHALGLSMLRAEGARHKRRVRLAVFDTGDQLSCLREICRRVKLDRNLDLGSILTRISAYKNAFVEPASAPGGKDPYDQAAALLYPYYAEQLEAYSAVDFDDLVCRPCRMMESSAACRERWSTRFRYVLVDEYQDTNGAQLRMLRAIAGSHRNLCVVGDDDQSIYGWRGAQVENILRFERDFPGAKVVYLQRNYRSVGAVLELANTVIARNPKRHEKRLVPVRGPGSPVRMMVFPDGDAEATWIAGHVREALRERDLRPGEVAVLYRSNLFSRDLETALRAEGISYRVLGGTAFFDSKEVKDLLAYLRICVYPTDEISLRRVINAPPRGIGPRTVASLAGWAEKNGTSFHKALERADAIIGPGKATAAVEGFLALIRRSRARFKNGRQLAQGLRALLDELQLEQAVQQSSTNVKVIDRRMAHLHGMVEGLRSYAEHTPRPSLEDYLNRVALSSADDDQDDAGGERVTLSSLHGAKGLEFRLVVLAGMEEGYLPHERTLNPHQNDLDVGDIAEERRLCYVGITRAMDELVVTRCRERMVRGKLQPRTPSRFLEGIDLEVDDLSREVTNEEVQSAVADLLARLEG